MEQFKDLQAQRESGTEAKPDMVREVPPWERDDAPAGSTSESLMVYERGQAVRVAGPTHYVHLANGRVIADYGIGTHYSEADPNGGPDRILSIIGIHAGG